MAKRARSARTGRFIKTASARRRPKTTVVEKTASSKGRVTVQVGRSAVSGRFITKAAVARHPSKTVVTTIRRKR